MLIKADPAKVKDYAQVKPGFTLADIHDRLE